MLLYIRTWNSVNWGIIVLIMQDKPQVMEAPSHTVSSKDENVVKEPSNSLRIGKTLLTCATFVTFVSTLIYFLQFPWVMHLNTIMVFCRVSWSAPRGLPCWISANWWGWAWQQFPTCLSSGRLDLLAVLSSVSWLKWQGTRKCDKCLIPSLIQGLIFGFFFWQNRVNGRLELAVVLELFYFLHFARIITSISWTRFLRKLITSSRTTSFIHCTTKHL